MAVKRKRWSTKARAALFLAHKGICHLCSGVIQPTVEAWEISHDLPLELGGADDETNCFPAHKKCHRVRTSTVDIPAIAKARRVVARHTGARAPSARPIPRAEKPAKPPGKALPPRRNLYGE